MRGRVAAPECAARLVPFVAQARAWASNFSAFGGQFGARARAGEEPRAQRLSPAPARRAETVDCVTPSRSAVRWKLRVSSRSRKVSRSSICMVRLPDRVFRSIGAVRAELKAAPREADTRQRNSRRRSWRIFPTRRGWSSSAAGRSGPRRFIIWQGGLDGCVLLEKNELTAGSTWHAAGNVPTFSSSWSIMNMQRYSAELYRGLGEAVDYPMNYHVTGSVRLAHTARTAAGVSARRRDGALSGDGSEDPGAGRDQVASIRSWKRMI